MTVQESNEQSSLLLDSRQDNYQSTEHEWNVEIDVKGQVNTGPEQENIVFSLRKLLKYTGPGKNQMKSALTFPY